MPWIASLSSLLVLSGCEREAPPTTPAPLPADQLASAATSEPLLVERGERRVAVSCQRSCERTELELGRLLERCVVDPRSTPHHVSSSAALVALGCCLEAESVVREACGDEGSFGPCLAGWAGRCERGELAPARPAEGLGPEEPR